MVITSFFFPFNVNLFVKSEVPVVVKTFFCVVTPCALLGRYQRFGEKCSCVRICLLVRTASQPR
jgi:hypothetical protein